ncbi:hypothetical protein BP6252_02538 [Coleophoma cylindrospora]|uniref:Uncharacterized protein n=1 Tax=Coleophoma cylindrospora TaxID=1849047 RepID=A0A3D8SGR2_9HELO|nr:hypothetical protein BP6252_02538 [Coleophoma cylindrospora]
MAFATLWDQIRQVAPSTWLVLSLVGLVTYFTSVRSLTPLRSIPGPFLASITRLWIFLHQTRRKRQDLDRSLHVRYGPIVRISPREVLVSSPDSFKAIYAASSKFVKAEWYQATGDGGWAGKDGLDFLNEMDMDKYRTQRRLIGPAYTADAMKDLEGNLNAILERNIAIMRERDGMNVDVDDFFNLFTVDCLSQATFSKSKGLVEANKDDGAIGLIKGAWKFMHLVGLYPGIFQAMLWVTHRIINPGGSLLAYVKPRLRATIVTKDMPVAKDTTQNAFTWCVAEFQKRKDSPAPIPEHAPDIASKLFQIQASKPGLKDHWLRNTLLTNFGAGGETTAIVISALLIALLSHPESMERVREEIDRASREGKLGNPPSLRDLREHLPFLEACLNESMRLHPIVGMSLMRVVPEGGCTLEGHFLPAGTIVGINPWVISRDKSLYGQDADEWRPERWLEYGAEKLKALETYNVSFGTGARSCPGKHLAQAIYYKMIPMLFMNFDWSFVEPGAKRVIESTFSTRYINMKVRWKNRV